MLGPYNSTKASCGGREGEKKKELERAQDASLQGGKHPARRPGRLPQGMGKSKTLFWGSDSDPLFKLSFKKYSSRSY